MKVIGLKTHYAPADREETHRFSALPEKFARMEQLQWLERLPLMVFLTNPYRQIVYSNSSFNRILAPYTHSVIGLRPGEALGCIYAQEMEGGCGCSIYCRQCGSVRAILKSLQGVEDCRECHILVRDALGIRALDLQVLARPFHHEGHIFSLNTAFDVSHERRLAALNKTFLHNMINAAGGMETMLSLLEMDQASNLRQHVPLLHQCTLTMLQEVLYQYDITAAEAGRLALNIRQYEVSALIGRLGEQLRHHATAHCRHIVLNGPRCHVELDARIFRHILSNLIINALEASAKDEDVVVHWEDKAPGVWVHVDNGGTIPEDIAVQLFKRYVSTKGEERGLGLYMSKVFAENYLSSVLNYVPLAGRTRFSLLVP